MAEQLDIESIFKFKVDELKQELGKRGLPKSGSKADLQERLLQYVSNETTASADDDETHEDLDATTPANEPAIEDVELNEPVIEDIELNEPAIEDVELNELLEDKAENLLDTLDKSDLSEGKNLDKSENIQYDCDSKNEIENDIITNPIDDSDLKEKDSINVDGNDKNMDNIEKSLNVEDESKYSKDDIFWGNSKESYTNAKDDTVTNNKEESAPKISRVKITFSTESNIDKKGDRSKRFGEASSETEKKKARMDRFSLSKSGMSTSEPLTEEDVEKIKKRAERFGAISTVITNPKSKDRLEQRKERFADSTLKKRQERFGIVQKTSPETSSTDSEKKGLRLAKFGTV